MSISRWLKIVAYTLLPYISTIVRYAKGLKWASTLHALSHKIEIVDC